jgi:RNA polymerase sigma-70 factor (ECF subfamily)
VTEGLGGATAARERLRELVPYAHGLARKLAADEETARDLAQEALAKAWEKQDQLEDPVKAKPWLRRITVNLFLSQLRATGKMRINEAYNEADAHDPLEDIADTQRPSPVEETMASHEVLALRDGCFLAMARKLTLEQRVAFSLRCMFGLTLEETSAYLGCSPGAAKALVHRATANLSAFFCGHCVWIDPNAADCHCEAWVGFTERRAENQKKARRKLIESFPEAPSSASVPPEKRKLVLARYLAMPDRGPGADWYDSVINSL